MSIKERDVVHMVLYDIIENKTINAVDGGASDDSSNENGMAQK